MMKFILLLLFLSQTCWSSEQNIDHLLILDFESKSAAIHCINENQSTVLDNKKLWFSSLDQSYLLTESDYMKYALECFKKNKIEQKFQLFVGQSQSKDLYPLLVFKYDQEEKIKTKLRQIRFYKLITDIAQSEDKIITLLTKLSTDHELYKLIKNLRLKLFAWDIFNIRYHKNVESFLTYLTETIVQQHCLNGMGTIAADLQLPVTMFVVGLLDNKSRDIIRQHTITFLENEQAFSFKKEGFLLLPNGTVQCFALSRSKT